MISDEDTILLKQLQTMNPEIYSLFERIEQDHNNTISKVSHDIKNIISILSSSFQFIESQHPETSDFNLWPHLKSSISYLVQFIDQTYLYQHSERIEIKPINLQNLLWSIPDIMDDLYRSNTNIGIRDFNYDISKDLPEINGDYDKLKIAFVEIVMNAFEATSVNDSINISAHIVDNTIAISIKDKGIGIDRNIMNDITTPYFTTKQLHAGTGLSIAKQVASSHGGNLSISSNEYTCITITLPL